MALTSTGPDRHRRRSRRDAYGLEITVDSPQALDLYNQGVESLLGFGDAARRFFEEAVQVEEDFALAHGMIAVCHFLEERAAEARAALDVAQRDAARLTPRERQHLQALALWVGGRSGEAASLIRDVLKEYPRDITLVQRLFFIEFWRGGFPAILELTSSFHLAAGEYARVMEQYHEGIRACGFQMPQELHDAISLLWRQWLSGREMGPLWHDVADFARERIAKPNLLFHDLHLGMALAAAGDFEAVERQRTILGAPSRHVRPSSSRLVCRYSRAW
jgi:hypothetical protein